MLLTARLRRVVSLARYLDNFNDIWIRNVLSDTERPLVDKASDKVTDELLHSATNTTDNTFSRLNTL